jgi:antitoxin ParD1/3/4
MPGRANKPISVTLGPLAKRAEARVTSGEYASISEVVREGLRALDRQDRLFAEILRVKVEEALADPRPNLSSEEVWSDINRRHQERLKSGA